MSTDFVGVADLAVFLDVDVTTLDLATANLATKAAQQKVRQYLNQVITYVTGDVVLLDGNGKFRIRLPERPIRKITLIEEEGSNDEWDEVAATDYRLKDARYGIVVRQDGVSWPAGYANIRVTYDHGWNTNPVIDSDMSDSDFDTDLNALPADISLVTLSLARRMYENMGSAAGAGTAGNIKQETIGAYSYTLSAAAEKAAGVDLVFAEKSVLDSYRMEGAG